MILFTSWVEFIELQIKYFSGQFDAKLSRFSKFCGASLSGMCFDLLLSKLQFVGLDPTLSRRTAF